MQVEAPPPSRSGHGMALSIRQTPGASWQDSRTYSVVQNSSGGHRRGKGVRCDPDGGYLELRDLCVRIKVGIRKQVHRRLTVMHRNEQLTAACRSEKRARITTDPRREATRTSSPSATPSLVASSGWMSTVGRFPGVEPLCAPSHRPRMPVIHLAPRVEKERVLLIR